MWQTILAHLTRWADALDRWRPRTIVATMLGGSVVWTFMGLLAMGLLIPFDEMTKVEEAMERATAPPSVTATPTPSATPPSREVTPTPSATPTPSPTTPPAPRVAPPPVEEPDPVPVEPVPPLPPIPAPDPVAPPPAATYSSCADARAAGVAPLYAGAPGYSTGLDRDRDGVACE